METHNWNEHECPVCGSKQVLTFLELSDMPVQDGVVYDSEAAAKQSPVGDINLAICQNCLYIGNRTYDSSKIHFTEYNYSQHHSPKYQHYIKSLVSDLSESYHLRNKTVVDVGCGKGYFLNELCKGGQNRGFGIDPSYKVTAEVSVDQENLTFIKDFYSEKYAYINGDFVSCRHVIDELEWPKRFVSPLKGALRENEDSLVFLELPNGLTTFKKELFWNIGYAKRSWFTPASLSTFIQYCGFQVVHVKELFDDQYLGIVGKINFSNSAPDSIAGEVLSEMNTLLKKFADNFKNEIEHWEKKIETLEGANEQIIIWGAGMRGLNFLNKFANKKVIPAIVDINPNRQGKYLPGSGYRIDSIDLLKTIKPDKILISNPTYEKEIKTQAAAMGLTSTFYNL